VLKFGKRDEVCSLKPCIDKEQNTELKIPKNLIALSIFAKNLHT
tara:strand:- start:12124 stop:12255 length:132 start_codon:yes stop_codon:yes gene_type:complete